jgi:hypothetical protein
MRFTLAPHFRYARWAVLLLILFFVVTMSSAQIPLRGPPLNMRPPPQILNVPNPNNPSGPPLTIVVQAKVQLMPGKQPPAPLNNGSLTPWFVYNILPGMLGVSGGGNSFSGGSFGGNGGSFSGGFSGVGGGGVSGFGGGVGGFGGGIGGFGGGIGGIGGFGGNVGGFGGFTGAGGGGFTGAGGGGFIMNPGGGFSGFGGGFGGAFGMDGGGF